MKLRELLEKCNIVAYGGDGAKMLLDYELVAHPGDGGQADNVVDIQLVHEVHSIYLEYE